MKISRQIIDLVKEAALKNIGKTINIKDLVRAAGLVVANPYCYSSDAYDELEVEGWEIKRIGRAYRVIGRKKERVAPVPSGAPTIDEIIDVGEPVKFIGNINKETVIPEPKQIKHPAAETKCKSALRLADTEIKIDDLINLLTTLKSWTGNNVSLVSLHIRSREVDDR